MYYDLFFEMFQKLHKFIYFTHSCCGARSTTHFHPQHQSSQVSKNRGRAACAALWPEAGGKKSHF